MRPLSKNHKLSNRTRVTLIGIIVTLLALSFLQKSCFKNVKQDIERRNLEAIRIKEKLISSDSLLSVYINGDPVGFEEPLSSQPISVPTNSDKKRPFEETQAPLEIKASVEPKADTLESKKETPAAPAPKLEPNVPSENRKASPRLINNLMADVPKGDRKSDSVVKAGEAMFSIAKKNEISIEQIRKLLNGSLTNLYHDSLNRLLEGNHEDLNYSNLGKGYEINVGKKIESSRKYPDKVLLVFNPYQSFRMGFMKTEAKVVGTTIEKINVSNDKFVAIKYDELKKYSPDDYAAAVYVDFWNAQKNSEGKLRPKYSVSKVTINGKEVELRTRFKFEDALEELIKSLEF